jgi:hypothetical protein
MTLYHLAYASRPFGYDEGTLDAILATARGRNARDGITGTLICRDDLFVQFLEGPEPAVEAAFARIARDDRHVGVERLFSGPAGERRFAAWAMRHDPVREWMWSREAVEAGAPAGTAPEALLAVFDRVAADPHDAPPARCPV